jgi:hypothetical protein
LGGDPRVGSSPTFGTIQVAELCSGSTGDFGSLSPGSNPGSAAIFSRSLSWELKKIFNNY